MEEAEKSLKLKHWKKSMKSLMMKKLIPHTLKMKMEWKVAVY